MLLYACCFVLHTIACPGRVYVTSIKPTCNSVTINWALPRDENNIPYDVRLKYSYGPEKLIADVYYTIVSAASYKVVDLPSDVLVKFSLRAINKREKRGPKTVYTVRTRKPCEPMLCYTERAINTCVRIGTQLTVVPT